ncbi:CIC11C00000002300 [Sungouiella intermedia]|uniref:CIC11C00000002300 n=1 Tax=Sungouiella intermedia TaxID=45354 RepID=A0A1L0BVT1_9ASCO|nr:CIC11C00000002300 [[Candida] intermedia]
MTLTEQTAVSVPPSPASPPAGGSLHSESNLIPRIVSFSDDSLLQVPLDTSIVDRLLATGPLGPQTDFSSIANMLPSKHSIIVTCQDENGEGDLDENLSEDLDDDNEESLDQPLEILTSKSKRSSSTSNDMIYERDRFRARFESFNSPKNGTVISEEHSENAEEECEVCCQILTKTKKVDVAMRPDLLMSSSTSSTDSVLELLFNYSIKETVSPLSTSSLFFKNHLNPLMATSPAEVLFNLRSITPPQLALVFQWYFNKPLPSTTRMFPWLHGLHKDNFTQRSFFISQQISQGASMPGTPVNFDVEEERPANARFVMCVESSEIGGFGSIESESDESCVSSLKLLRNTVSMDEILQRIQYSRAEVISKVRALIFAAFPPEKYSARNILDLTDLIVRDCFETSHMPVLLNLDPDRGVSLRNFHIQVAKLAKCSDFVVYCFEKEHHLNRCKCHSVSRLLKLAQMSDKVGLSQFNVFLFNANGNGLEKKYPELFTMRDNSPILNGLEASKKTQLTLNSMVTLKSDTFTVWESDYQLKEKVETTRMSAATRLLKNVWLGNIWDHQIMMHFWLSQEGENEVPFDINISAPEKNGNIYCDPENSCLTRDSFGPTENLISFLPPPRAHWKLFIHCHNDARFPDAETLGDLLFKYTISSRKANDVDEIIHLEFPSSGSIGFGDCKQDNLMSIVNTCKLLYLYSSSMAEGSLAALIYSSDGYTELSLLTFCYLMYAEDLSLEEAMLRLHKDYGRPFYIFNSDVLVLQKLQILLRRFSPVALRNRIDWGSQEAISCQEINEILLGRTNSVPSKGIPNRLKLGYIANDSDEDSSDSDDGSEDDINDTSSFLDRSWVEEVEGSFPSRILPYLYLGSLKHANSLSLLSKLGIKKVISVGEELDWLNGYKFQHNNDIIVDEVDNGNIELFNITPKNTSYNKYNSKCSVEGVVKINNLQDDGIDELTKSLPQILEQIDLEYRKTKGNTKILVHCRVGVSRSATVVIAEVMRRLGLNLPQAYLYVRVRRLNIVIQPNLRFMYELFKWEEQERAIKQSTDKNLNLREIDWFVMCREIKKLNLPFLQN